MERQARDVLNGSYGNYLLPFLWQHDGNREKLKAQVQQVYQSGARAFCIESRPHEHFGEDAWWEDVEILLAEAKRLDMKVWILDDKHFPTGYANGLIEKKYPHLRKWQLMEKHVDVMGPMDGASLLYQPQGGFFGAQPDGNPDPDELLGVYAYRRINASEEIENVPIDLTANVQDGYLYWDIPEGCWRVFFYYKTRKGHRRGEENYIHLIDKESVKVLIEAVYEPHYEHFKEYFGTTLVGFFSDEPSLGNGPVMSFGMKSNEMYDEKLGMPGLALPWSDELYGLMQDALGPGALSKMAGLWYPMGDQTPYIRYAYMDVVTRLYRDAFSYQLGNWCAGHNVEYIGHIIEDMNAHARLGCSAGHYFRSLEGQHMSGIDIVLHQVIPGFGQLKHTCIGAGGMADPEFFHYVLGKLGASLAHLNPRTKGRAMCEVFGAYGWAEGVPMMKWLMDHLLVRGINHFVPHAFSPKFPDPDCPPHFGAEGRDPQFAGFGKLMGYVNRVSHLLAGAAHVANAAILYHAEAEWMNGDDCMLTQKPAKVLYDAHIDYDIVPIDSLLLGKNAEGKLKIHSESYDCLVVPFASKLPVQAVRAINKLQRDGVAVVYVDGAPQGAENPTVVALRQLASELIGRGMTDILVEKTYPLLRIYHAIRGNEQYVMLFNESVTEAVDTRIQMPVAGDYLRMNLLDEVYDRGNTADGWIPVHLTPYQSIIIAAGGAYGDIQAAEQYAYYQDNPDLTYNISLCASGANDFEAYGTADRLTNITGRDAKPDFSGTVRYETQFNVGDVGDKVLLDLGRVGQVAHVKVNGKDLGLRICPPYRFDITEAVVQGDNEVTIDIANTLVHTVKDVFSTNIQIPPSGLMGPVSVIHARRIG